MQKSRKNRGFVFIEGNQRGKMVKAKDYSGNRETEGTRCACELILSAGSGQTLPLYIQSADEGREFHSLPEYLEFADEALESDNWAAIADGVPGSCYDAETGKLTLPFIGTKNGVVEELCKTFAPDDDAPLILMMTDASVVIIVD